MFTQTIFIAGIRYRPFEQKFDARKEGLDNWLARIEGETLRLARLRGETTTQQGADSNGK